MICFFSPSSLNESPLSLHRFKFTEKSTDSVSLFFSLFFFVVVDYDEGCFAVVVATVVTVGTVVAVIGFVIWFSVGFLTGVFFFSSLLYPGPPLFFFVRVIPSFWFGAFACCCCNPFGHRSRSYCYCRCGCCCCYWLYYCFGGLLRAGF